MKIMAVLLEQAGVDAITVSAGTEGGSVPFDPQHPQYTMRSLPMGTPHKAFANFAHQLKEVLYIPVIAVGKILTAQDIEDVLTLGQADFVALGRSLLADPMWIRKVLEQREKDIRPCIACNQGCFGRLADQQDIRCTVNPDVGRLPCTIYRDTVSRNVMVVGGGAAGMQAALTAAERRHRVTLWERNDELGGQMILASILPNRREIGAFKEYLVRQLDEQGVEIHLNVEVTRKLIEQKKPDLVILATGGVPTFPGIFRTKGSVTAWELLQQKERPIGRYVILGGGLVGCETADLLAENPKNTVTIVEMLPEVARKESSDIKSFLKEKLSRYGVRIICGAKLESFTKKEAIVSVKGKQEKLPCDYLVVALGTYANQTLANKLGNTDVLTYVVGDALSPKGILDAIADGARVSSII
jgi:NADPH-dependent 2,4-dienoyl-CoA reductase/sulfur reductase-like enzyme